MYLYFVTHTSITLENCRKTSMGRKVVQMEKKEKMQLNLARKDPTFLLIRLGTTQRVKRYSRLINQSPFYINSWHFLI